MKNARVLIAEGRLGWPTTFEEQLTDDGHEVAAKVGSLDETAEALQAMADDQLDVAMVDVYVNRWGQDTSDGHAICRLLREKFASLVIIDTSDEGSLKHLGLADHHEPRLDDSRRVTLTGYLDVIDSL